MIDINEFITQSIILNGIQLILLFWFQDIIVYLIKKK